MSRRGHSIRWRVLGPVIALLACALSVPAATAEEDTGPRRGGTVTVVVPEDDGVVASLDPSASWSTLSTSILQQLLTRSLTTYRPDPKTGELELVPDLATDLGRPNRTFTEWSFTLRKGVRFENGRRVTADDVRFGIERSFDGNNGTKGGGLAGPGTEYSRQYFAKGAAYNGPYAEDAAPYEGVTVEGRTITIKMRRPFPDMASWASFPAIGPIPRGDASKPATYSRRPLATGPYRVGEFEPGERLVLVRNEHWQPSTDPTRSAWPDRWVFRFGADPATADALLLSDAYDGRRVILTSLLPQSAQDARQRLGERVVQVDTPCGNYLTLDWKKIRKLRVRQAIAHAYPHEAAWRAAGEVPGVTRTSGDALLPPGVPGRRDVRLDDGQHISHDPAQARRLLRQAGVEPGEFRLSWPHDSRDPNARETARVVAEAFEDAGFEADPIAYPGSTRDLLRDAAAGKDRAEKVIARANMEQISFCADWPSGSTFLPALLRADSPYNPSGFRAKAFDAEVARVMRMAAAKGQAAWGALDASVQERWLPMFPTGYVRDVMAHGSDIGGLTGDEHGGPGFRNVHVLAP